MIQEYEDLIPQMVPELPGASQDLIVHYLRRAAHHFAEQSGGFLYTDELDLVADQREYQITPGNDEEIRSIYAVYIRQAAQVGADTDGLRLDPVHYRFDSATNTITLSSEYEPASAVTGGLLVSYLAVPAPNAEQINPEVMKRYHDAISGYALYELMSMNNRRWSDEKRAMFHYGRYLSGKGEIRKQRITNGREASSLLLGGSNHSGPGAGGFLQ